MRSIIVTSALLGYLLVVDAAAVAAPAVPLEQVLRPDGTLDLHGQPGSMDASGWRMRIAESGVPHFERENGTMEGGPVGPAARQESASGVDDCWNGAVLGMDNGVSALAVDGVGNLYAGGGFTSAGGVSATGIARWNGTTWSALGAGMNGSVSALAVDGVGNLYAGGNFTNAGGVTASFIAKWDGTTWSPLGAGMSGAVYALAMDGAGNLYAGGAFIVAGAVLANRIAVWNGTAWSALGTGMNSTIRALALDGGGNLYAGGDFTTAGGGSANRIARWNGTTWSALGTGMNNMIRALALDSSGRLYAGGDFTTAGSVNSRIVRWNGATWSSMDVPDMVSGTVFALAVDGDDNLYASWASLDGHVARLDASFLDWYELGTGLFMTVQALLVTGVGNLYAGGTFSIIGEVPANNIARWNGLSWSPLSNGPDGSVYAVAVDGAGNLYAGGAFVIAGGATANHIAKWNGTSWSALGAGMDGSVHALAADGTGNLYAGGVFTTAGGVSANRIAKWNGASWSTLGTGMNSVVIALAVDGANLYAGGWFGTAGGVSANRVARWNGTTWSGLGTGMNGEVRTLAVAGDGTLYAGGLFSNAGGVSLNNVAKWNGTTWAALGAGTNASISALAVDGGGTVYAGGDFTTAGGVGANRIARWNGASWSALGTGMNNPIVTLAVDGVGTVYAGGSFTTAGGAMANRIARWNGTSWSALGAGMNEGVDDLLVDGGGSRILVGGAFTTAGGKGSPFVAELDLNSTYRDGDGDGYGDPGALAFDCGTSAGYVANNTDCNDTDATIHPGAADFTCDGIDNDCDGTVDDGVACVCVENAPGLAGWWRADGNALDAAAGNHGTLVGNAGYAAGRVGQAFSVGLLSGATSYVANLGDAYSYAFIENTVVFTINAWIKLNDPNALGLQAITANTATNSEKGHYFIWRNIAGEQRLNLTLMKTNPSVPVIDATTPDHVITDNGWHHVAAVGNGTTITFYVDGVAYPGGGTLTAKPNGPSTRAVDLGRIAPYGSEFVFNGLIDELEIHDRALSGAQVRAIYDTGANGMCGTGCAQNVPGLVGWWPGSGDAGDRSAFNNHGGLVGNVGFGLGKVGTAFSNVDGFVVIPDSPSLEMTSQLTLASWVRPVDAALGNSARIISKGLPYELLFDTNSNLIPRGTISNDGINYDALISPVGLSVGVWSHVAMTFNAGAWKLYIDGNETASTMSLMTSIYSAGDFNLCLGSYPTGSGRFVGLIDEPMVFNRALNALEIQALYEAGANGLCALGQVVGVDEPTTPTRVSGLQLLAPRPNPARASVDLAFRLSEGSPVTLEVFDVAGRRVASVAGGEWLPPGEHRLTWDGRGRGGNRLGSGVYSVRLADGHRSATQRLVILAP